MEGTSAYIIIINATFGWIICQELTNCNKSVHFRHFRMLYNALKMNQCDVKIQKNFTTNLATAQNRRCLGLLHHTLLASCNEPSLCKLYHGFLRQLWA